MDHDLVLVLGVGWLLALGLGIVHRARQRKPTRDGYVVLLAAFTEAQARGHRVVDEPHVLLALSFEASVSAAIANAGGDVESLRDALEARLASPELAEDSSNIRPSAAVGMLLRRAERRVPQRRPIEPFHILEAILDGPPTWVRDLLERHGVDRRALARRERAPITVPGGPYRGSPKKTAALVFWNDDTTTMEFVVRAVTEVLGKRESEARWLMLRTDRMGSARLGAWEPSEATMLAERIERMARSEGYPLRVSVEPDRIPEDPPSPHSCPSAALRAPKFT